MRSTIVKRHTAKKTKKPENIPCALEFLSSVFSFVHANVSRMFFVARASVFCLSSACNRERASTTATAQAFVFFRENGEVEFLEKV